MSWLILGSSSSQVGLCCCVWYMYVSCHSYGRTPQGHCILRLHTEAIATIPADWDDKQHYKNSAGWDTYHDEGLKSQTRAKREETIGQRTTVSANTPMAKGAEWQKFLKESHNKDDLFQIPMEQGIISSSQRLNVYSPTNQWICQMSPCQQQADTRVMLHLHHTAEQSHRKDSGHWCGHSRKISLPWAMFD
jgi:hypothetical protein